MPTLTHDEIDERACELRRHLEDAVRRVLEVRGPLALTALVRRVHPLVFHGVTRRNAIVDFNELHTQQVLIERAISRITYEGDVLCERARGTWLYRLPMCDTPQHSL